MNNDQQLTPKPITNYRWTKNQTVHEPQNTIFCNTKTAKTLLKKSRVNGKPCGTEQQTKGQGQRHHYEHHRYRHQRVEQQNPERTVTRLIRFIKPQETNWTETSKNPVFRPESPSGRLMKTITGRETRGPTTATQRCGISAKTLTRNTWSATNNK